MLEQLKRWQENEATVRLVVNYGNNTVKAWTGKIKHFDQLGIVISDKGNEVGFTWFTITEFSEVK